MLITGLQCLLAYLLTCLLPRSPPYDNVVVRRFDRQLKLGSLLRLLADKVNPNKGEMVGDVSFFVKKQ